jgi:Glycosyltransferase family 87
VTSTHNSARSWQDRRRTALEIVIVIVCTLAFTVSITFVCFLMFSGGDPGHRDFVSFWAAGHQIDLHQNPYDAPSILKLEWSAGFVNPQTALIARNPPPALCLMMPFGPLAAKPACVIWLFLLLSGLILSVYLLWRMHRSPANKLHFLAFTFGPAISCILVGQTAIFALVGLVLFLRLHRTRQFAAGMALWLCALKPHLFLPFSAALLLWVVINRAYKVLAASILTLALSSWIAWHLDASIWTQYNQMMHSAGLESEFIPCLAVAFRFALHPRAMWLQFVPAVAASVWALHFYWRSRNAWDWHNHGALLMLVSIVVSPYAWMSDQSLLIPALMVGLYRTTSRAQLYVPALVSAYIEIIPLTGQGMHSPLYVWAPPVMLAWFLYVSRKAPVDGASQTGMQDHAELERAVPAWSERQRIAPLECDQAGGRSL